MLVGQAVAQGASKQYKQRSASSSAYECEKRGVASAKRLAYSSGGRRPAWMSGTWVAVVEVVTRTAPKKAVATGIC